ncbi:glutamate-1-semialdehyde aminotransferase [Campylobacter hyointestinalis]|uniref:glutamate-1-semialdehyde 2,1-aminomutase n=1 Tax=Campylobacter hyointestinalis TaxID=198 RepID=UPI0004D6D33C|nr:glutamate-1-semialdehyde 2,1-aminomutase [Campylobacter hyointestinalis]KEA44223.1 glutamate-1-semialdehyde aminotransferase [Campylobacter hyointestinalis subsp. hyointestinalis]QKF55430.1 glutamate-1-semialdehyde aminotransferase [Campylobacter hyointestinalis subsp. hyointestinalis]TXK47227.1 glutamate-1-semialdehyde-2,1-aminomutase [Campylobacter hyointestinalis]SFT55068.1 glutamate-1-semialdehyde 2,1-aminomutase [Campylobacter hyointestinalis]SUW90168.1 glutamate-1-semialdehyde aminotr
MTNKQAFLEAKKYIPGGVDSPVRAFGSVGEDPLIIDHGKDEFLYDIEGKQYVDYVLSWGPLIFGHCEKDIENAVINTAKKGLSFGAPCLLETELAKLVLSKFEWLDKIRFVSSGTEATMSAIRLGRGFSGKDGIVKFEGCYHGHSDSLLVKAGSGATTFGYSSSLGVPEDIVKNTHLATYNDLESVEKCFKNADIGVIIVEPIAGNMGLVPGNLKFLEGLRKICDKFGAVLIFDEVMSGFRASETGSYEFNKIKADIITFGKVIGGGMPCAAYAGKKEIMDLISPLGGVYQAGTLSGNPVAMAAGLASLNKIYATPNLYDELGKKSKFIIDTLQSSANEAGIPLQTDMRGSMWGYFFNENPVKNYADALKSDTKMFAKFHAQMLKRGIYLAPSQFETSFVCTKLSKDSLDKTASAVKESFKAL